MPGFRDRQMYARCPECDGPDLGNAGFPVHYPTCSTQPGHEEARKAEAESKAERRREIDAMVADPETQRRLALRQARRVGED
jgi:hypothetical protein